MISRRSMFGMLAAGAVALASKTRLAESSIAPAARTLPCNVFKIKSLGIDLLAGDVVSLGLTVEVAKQYGLPQKLELRVTKVDGDGVYLLREDMATYLADD